MNIILGIGQAVKVLGSMASVGKEQWDKAMTKMVCKSTQATGKPAGLVGKGLERFGSVACGYRLWSNHENEGAVGSGIEGISGLV